MNMNPTANKLPVFLIIDYTGGMFTYVSTLEHYLRHFVKQLKQEGIWPQLEFDLLGMGGKTGVLATESIIQGGQSLTKQLPRCDLDRALTKVHDALVNRVTNYKVKGEVFIILGNQPSTSGWEQEVQKLDRLGVNVTSFALIKVSSKDWINKVKAGTGNFWSLNSLSNDNVEWLFRNAIIPQIKNALATKGMPSPAKPLAGVGRGTSGDKHEAATRLWQSGQTFQGAVTPPEAMPRLADTQGVANIWKELKPTDPRDSVPDEVKEKKDTADGWRIIGASRRGKMHAHKGIYREDAFALGEVAGWHLMVVADGGGSCPLSRVGSQLAANTAVTEMEDVIKSRGDSKSPQEICQIALKSSLRVAWQALEKEAQKRRIPMGHLGTTFLAVIHRPSETGAVVGVAQVGDGLVVAELANGKIISLGEPDVGETAGVTFFLTSKDWTEWLDKVNVEIRQTPIRLLAAMCDGVADDFIPFKPYIEQLLQALDQKVLVDPREPEQALLEYLGYEKRGSFDDRTLTLLYQPSA